MQLQFQFIAQQLLHFSSFKKWHIICSPEKEQKREEGSIAFKVERHISWQQNRKQEIRYQEISCRKKGILPGNFLVFVKIGQKLAKSQWGQRILPRPGICLFIDVHTFNWINIYKRISNVLKSWCPDVLMSWSEFFLWLGKSEWFCFERTIGLWRTHLLQS